MPNFIDLTGQRFDRLVVLERVPDALTTTWLCRCDCGREKPVTTGNLRRGLTRSCGCLSAEMAKARGGHGKWRDPLYRIWAAMIRRCTKPNTINWDRYGGRGIRVCDQWHDYATFAADMGQRPSKRHSLERIDNDKGYEPGNVRWATTREQARNMRSNRMVTYQGETLTIADWSERMGIPYMTLRWRLTAGGWPVKQAMTTQTLPYGRTRKNHL